MTAFAVDFDPAAEADLDDIGRYIAGKASVAIALGFIDRLERACLSLADAPWRGTTRDEIRPGLRTFGVERRATIVFAIDEDARRVVILAVLFGGQDMRKALRRRATK